MLQCLFELEVGEEGFQFLKNRLYYLMKTLMRFFGFSLFVLCVTSFGAMGADSTAKGGGKKLTELNTSGAIAALEKGDVVVSVCPKCKTVTQTRVKSTAKGGGLGKETVTMHGCPGCGAKFEVTGHGKAKDEKVTHVCTHCGSAEAFCSVIKKKDL